MFKIIDDAIHFPMPGTMYNRR